jgi:acyl-CoA thioesterase-1
MKMMNLLWRRCILLLLIAGNAYADTPTILVLGDSISAAYGINTDQGWVALLQKQLQENAYKYRVINASVSGDTTRTGLNRLPAALRQHKPEILVAALGGNDGLRGLPFSEIENSLSQIIELGRNNHAQVVLVGVRLPPNYGEAYTRQFADLYLGMGKKYNIRVVPRLLDKVADHSELLQPDGIHPTAEGQAQIMRNVWVELEPLLLGAKEKT